MTLLQVKYVLQPIDELELQGFEYYASKFEKEINHRLMEIQKRAFEIVDIKYDNSEKSLSALILYKNKSESTT